MPVDGATLWSKAKPILLPYVGSASQIYVLDVPQSECATVVDLFVGFVEKPEIVCLDNYWDEPRPLTADLCKAILSHADRSTTHQLRGLRAGRENVDVFLWIDAESYTFDAELVFWSDQLFPQPDDESACIRIFQHYVSLAERIRSLSQHSECVLSAAETGDPRDDRDKAWTYWW